MNEIINAALEASGLLKVLDEHASEYGDGAYDSTMYPEAGLFAELIVRECIKTGKELYDECEPWGGIDGLYEHFGVEP